MAGVDGLVSGLDTASIIGELVAVARRPISKFQSQFTELSAKRDAMTELNSLLTALSSAVEAVDTQTELAAYSVSSSSSSVGAIVSGDAIPGSYEVEVASPATGSLERSNGFASKLDTIDDGTLTLDIGGTPTVIDIDAATGTNTLDGLADYINTNVTGASAYILDTGSGASPFELVVQSSATGAANSITSSYSPDSVLATNTLSFTQVQTGADAQIEIAGTTVYTASNAPADVIPGVTLDFSGATSGPVTITVAEDRTTTSQNVQSVVDAYNELRDFIRDQAGSAESEGGPLAGDATLRTVGRRLQAIMSSVAGQGTLSGLGSLGLGSAQTGLLEFDSTEFGEALSSAPQDVMNMLVGTGGLFTSFVEELDLIADPSTGLIQPRIDSFETRMDDLADRVETQEARLVLYEESLREQFTAMELILAKYQATGDYLTQQLASLNNNKK